MLDQQDTAGREIADTDVAQFDLVVVGAGIAGLNALYSAAHYLPRGARALLIDDKPRAGGMWNTAYDYVRLHQPHRMFTVGDMAWAWTRPPAYLTARDEVRDHLERAVTEVGRKLDLATAFGCTVTACEEVETGGGGGARGRVAWHPNESPQDIRVVEAALVIHAPGLNYRLAAPLPLSSGNMVSIVPQELRPTLEAHPDAPVIVVGGGKTGMDTILAVLSENPGRSVVLVNGRGTNFLNRSKYVPTGLRRWTSGILISQLFRELAYDFDGDNEDAAIDAFRRKHSTAPDAMAGVFLYGLQSEEERARIDAGLGRVHAGYLADIVDGAAGPELVLRDGARAPTAPGSIAVNCTGSFFRDDALSPRAPCLSPEGSVLRIASRDGFHFLTSVSGFFLPHLLYCGALRGKGFYTLDHEALFRANRNAWVGAAGAQAYMNQVIAVQTLPMGVLDRCGLDLDRWYPLPRRLVGLLRMKARARTDIAHCRRLLDRIADRFGVHAAPL